MRLTHTPAAVAVNTNDAQRILAKSGRRVAGLRNRAALVESGLFTKTDLRVLFPNFKGDFETVAAWMRKQGLASARVHFALVKA